MFPVFLMLSGSWWVALATVVIGGVTTQFANDWRVSVVGPILATAVLAFPAFLWFVVVGSVNLSSVTVVVVVCVVWILIARWWGKSASSEMPKGIGWLTVVAAVLTSHALTRDWGQASTLNMVQSMGEDNGFFLDLVADTAQSGSLISPSTNMSGGLVVTALIALSSGLRRLRLDGQVTDPLDVAQTLQRLYFGMVYLAVLVASSIIIAFRTRCNALVDATTLVLSGGTAIAFSSGLMRGGHFSSLVAAVVIMCLLLTTFCAGFLTVSRRSVIIPMAMLLSLWQAWSPLFLVTVLALAWFLPQMFFSTSTWRWNIRAKVWIFAFCAFVVTGLSAWQVESIQAQLSLYLRSMNESGGEARVIGWFAALILVVALLSLPAPRDMVSTLDSAIVSSLCMSATLLMVLGWLVPPYQPEYGPNKFLYLVTFALSPLAIGWLRRRVESQTALVAATLLVVAVGSILQAAVSPLSELSLIVVKSTRAEWERGALEALNRYPDRNILCIETREDGDREYEAYRCSRLLNGMRGTSVWYMYGNLCRVPTRDIVNVPDSEWKRLTVLISDGRRLSSTDGCQTKGWAGDGIPTNKEYLLGWVSGIRWDLVKVISYDGKIVEPSFQFLGENLEYSEYEISALSRRSDD